MMIPYARQSISAEDIEAVVDVLQSDWLTQGPTVERFEAAVSSFCGAQYGVAVCSGTAALHAAMFAIGVGAGDEVIVPAMTFVATANGVLYQGGRPVFADVNSDDLLLDVTQIEALITPNTKAIIAVDYAGQPCDYVALSALAKKHGLVLVADASHSLGASAGEGGRVGALADLTVFSFHPVKPMTTGEGGMVVTDNADYVARLKRFRNHGIDRDSRDRQQSGQFQYAMVDLGFNYRISDIHCALGLSQLPRLGAWIVRRNEIARRYDDGFAELPGITPLTKQAGLIHGYHLYVVRVAQASAGVNRDQLFQLLRQRGIGVNVHYYPVHLQPYYRSALGTAAGLCPRAESASEEILSLPLYPDMSDAEVDEVIASVKDCVADKGVVHGKVCC